MWKLFKAEKCQEVLQWGNPSLMVHTLKEPPFNKEHNH